MKIRTITTFTPLTWPFDEGSVASLGRFLTDARLRLTESGFDVQNVCLATPPFLDVIGDPDPQALLDFAQALEVVADRYQIDAVSIGPVVATTPLALLMSIHALPQLIVKTKKIFSGVLFADDQSGINLSAARAFAETVFKVAQATPGGIGNFRLAALANVPPGFPLFPAAYHHGGASCFAVATEAADLAFSTIHKTHALGETRKRLVKVIEGVWDSMLGVIDDLVDDHNIRFNGIDFSLTPYPAQTKSLAAVIEKLGVDVFGGSGTLFASSFLSHCIGEANIPHTGFSGVILPVLEDEVLARRAAEGRYSVNDLLLYSASQGTGLDAIPIAGNTSPDELAAIYLDVASLAIALGKPLMARLLPIPGLTVGEKISFDQGHFATSRILPVKNLGNESLFQRNSFVQIKSSHNAKKIYL